MKTQDFIREPCSCGECQQAGVSALEQRRDPWTGKWLHGYDLKRWYQGSGRAFPNRGACSDTNWAGRRMRLTIRF